MPGKFRLKSNFSKWFAKTMLGVLFFLAATYFSLGFAVDENFFERDFHDKLGQVRGIKLSVHVDNDLDKPIVEAETGCNNSDPYVDLSWPADRTALSFTIERNRSVLAENIIGTEYRDEAIDDYEGYDYIVTAVGLYESISSDVAELTTAKCGKKAHPTCKIKTIDSKNINQFVGVPTVQNRQPVFAGNTNIKSAEMKMEIIGSTGILDHIDANENGFWKWQVPQELADGTYEIKVKATDPDDSWLYKSDSLIFKIESGQATVPEERPTVSESLPFDLETEVQNPDKNVYAGESLFLETVISQIENFESQTSELIYTIFDSNGAKVMEVSEQINIFGDQTMEKRLDLSRLLAEGKYKISVRTTYKNFHIFAEDYFFIKERTLIKLGTGYEVTWMWLMALLSWLFLLFLLLLLVFLLLLIIEHHLAGGAKIQITKEIFGARGFLGKGRGVKG